MDVGRTGSETQGASILRPHRWQTVDLFLASLLGLYFEMLVVRWLAAEVRLFSYFKNVTLIAAFLGLALGYALARRARSYLMYFGPLLLLYVPVVLVTGYLTGFRSIVVPGSTEFFWRAAALPPLVSTVVFALILGFFSILTLLLFIPMGQLTGRLMAGLPPLSAYMHNILGSLAGIVLFAAMSYWTSAPWIWFAVALLPVVWLARSSVRVVVSAAAPFLLIIIALADTARSSVWSPYYKIDIVPFSVDGKPMDDPEQFGYDLYVNQIGHMFALNLSPEFIAGRPDYASLLDKYRLLYELPYRAGDPQSVLVVGSGMGNDVAAALRCGAASVDAVEIDPVIYRLGREKHPERPYDSGAVNVYVDDARSFLEGSDRRYDVIVFGIVDSQTLLSGMGSIRLDNFLYTVESIRSASRHLAPDGVLAVTFDVEREWIRERLANTLEEVFGAPPLMISVADTAWIVFLAGPGLASADTSALCADESCTLQAAPGGGAVEPATDDWPYLYLQSRGIPVPYILAMVLIVLLAVLGARKVYPNARTINLVFLLLGAAFMLVEVRIITELALLFGSTWIVNAIAVSAVLLMVLLANRMVAAFRRVTADILLTGALIGTAAQLIVPLSSFLAYPFGLKLAAAVLLTGLPVFFASAAFSVLLRDAADITVAFSSNLLGSAVGSVLEYGSMAFGMRSLYVLVAVLYAASWYLHRRPAEKSPIPAG